MKKTSLLLCFLCTQLFFSQIGINTTVPNQSAMLDIVSNNKGVLVPRIALSSRTDAATIPSPATGLIIYNTITAGIGGDQITQERTINVLL